jgi:hypothetical protein
MSHGTEGELPLQQLTLWSASLARRPGSRRYQATAPRPVKPQEADRNLSGESRVSHSRKWVLHPIPIGLATRQSGPRSPE